MPDLMGNSSKGGCEQQGYSLVRLHFQTDKQLLPNQADMAAADEEQKTAAMIDVEIPADSNMRKKEHEKADKCQRLKEQLDQMWKVKLKVVPAVRVALGLEVWLQQSPASTLEVSKRVKSKE